MKNIYLNLVFILLFGTITYANVGNIPPFADVSSEMQYQAEMLLRYPDTREFLYSLQKEGPIALKWIPMGKDSFNACWYGEKRMVCLNSSKQWTESRKFFSILFELQNAYSNHQFVYLDELASKGQISKQSYVEAVETVEYQNVVRTIEFLKKGIHLGYFPSYTEIPVFSDFKEHLEIQKHTGHSAFIAQKYDLINKRFG